MQAEIIKDPAAYVELDPDMARTLLDPEAGGARAPAKEPSLACTMPSSQCLMSRRSQADSTCC